MTTMLFAREHQVCRHEQVCSDAQVGMEQVIMPSVAAGNSVLGSFQKAIVGLHLAIAAWRASVHMAMATSGPRFAPGKAVLVPDPAAHTCSELRSYGGKHGLL